MFLKGWDRIPEGLKNEETLKYYNMLTKKRFSLFLKRILDVIFSTILLVLFAPAFLILAILIKIDSKGPVFYRQERITQYGRPFRIFKFRTMVQNADKIGTAVTVQDDKRITKLGKTIRKIRLDELPQLINVLIGDMSFVGTRPEVKKYVDKYTDEMKATLLLKAGVTSPASIKYKDEDRILNKYKNSLKTIDEIYMEKILPEKMQYNLEYLKKFNIFRDLTICIDTATSVFWGRVI